MDFNQYNDLIKQQINKIMRIKKPKTSKNRSDNQPFFGDFV